MSQRSKRSRSAPPVDPSSASEEAVAVATTNPASSQEDRAATDDCVSGSQVLSVFTSDVVAPHPMGIRCVAKSHQEDRLFVCREDGSSILYKIDLHQNVAHFIPIRSGGGRLKRTIQRAAFTANDKYIIVAMLSGQLMILCAKTLVPVAVVPRSGGCVHDMASADNFLMTAVADGTWKLWYFDDSACALEVVQSMAKITGSDRALCVAMSQHTSIAVGGDDNGNVVAWRVPQLRSVAPGASLQDVARTQCPTLWTTRIAKGFPLALCMADHSMTADSLGKKSTSSSVVVDHSVNPFTPCVVVGSSIGDVTMIGLFDGHTLRKFSQHRGPVSALAFSVADGTVYASGWHESLRSYRCNPSDGEWFPAEVKRRTHYHEASALIVLDRGAQYVLSASRDGTLMHSPKATLFSSAAQYVDTTGQQYAFAQDRGILLQTRGNRIEAFTMSATRSHWVPTFAMAIQADKFNVVGLWCDKKLNVMVVATDARVIVVRLVWNAEGRLLKLSTVLSQAFVGVSDCTFHETKREDDATGVTAFHSYILGASQLLHVQVVHDDTTTTKKPREEPIMTIETPLTQIFDSVVVDSVTGSSLVLAGQDGAVRFSLHKDGFVDGDSMSSVTHRSVDNVSAATGAALLNEEQYSMLFSGSSNDTNNKNERRCTLAATLPHDVQMLTSSSAISPSTSEGAKPSKKIRVESEREGGALTIGSFSKGLLVADSKSWTMLQRLKMVKAFPMTNKSVDEDSADGKKTTCVLALERNIEASVEALPLCWKVRRFGN